MKIIAIFLLAITVSFSQNLEPTQGTFIYKNLNGNQVTGLLNGDVDYFKINNFIYKYYFYFFLFHLYYK